jgi:DNA topoisomerase IA
VKIENEEFTCQGKNPIENGWTDLMPWKQIDIKDIPSLKVGDVLKVGSVNNQ